MSPAREVSPSVVMCSRVPTRSRLTCLGAAGKLPPHPPTGRTALSQRVVATLMAVQAWANYRGHVATVRFRVSMVVCATVPIATSGGSVVIPLGAVLGRVAVLLAGSGCRGSIPVPPWPVQSCPGPGVRRIHLGSRRARPQSGPGQSSGLAVVCAALAEWATTARFRPARRLLPARGVARYRRTTSRFGPHPTHLHRRPEML